MENLKEKRHLYFKLFTSTFYLSAFTFGGGYVIIPLMKKKFVDDLKWIEEKEMLNMTAIAQATPGAVAVNAAILLGYRVAGVVGALMTILGTVLPPLIILSVISLFYTAFRENAVVNAVLKGMQSGVAAVIIDVVLTLGKEVIKDKDIIFILVMIAAFTATFVFNINIMYIILVSAVIGAVKIVVATRKEKHKGGISK